MSESAQPATPTMRAPDDCEWLPIEDDASIHRFELYGTAEPEDGEYRLLLAIISPEVVRGPTTARPTCSP